VKPRNNLELHALCPTCWRARGNSAFAVQLPANTEPRACIDCDTVVQSFYPVWL
jgi:hypothetical protein